MPKGVHTNHCGGKRPTCYCGVCLTCRHRAYDAKSRLRKKISDAISDDELTLRLIEKFFAAGWDDDGSAGFAS